MIDKIEINLIPATRAVRDKRLKISLRYLIIGTFAIALNLGMLVWMLILDNDILKQQTNIANIEGQIAVNRRIQEEIRTLTGLEREIRVKVEALRAINVDRAKWVDVLELYAGVLPSSTWITSVEEADGGVTISGMTEAVSEVGQFMNRLYEAENVGGVDLVEMRDAGRDGQLKSFTLRHTLVNVTRNQDGKE
jgi:Tfp pilus assembly protein PilN